MVVCVLATLVVGGCGDRVDDSYNFCGDGRPDPGEECDPGRDEMCTAGCTLPFVDVTAHWSFETLSGDTKAPCLPGSPAVTVRIQTFSSGGQTVAPCASGQTPMSVKTGLYSVDVTSVADHAYSRGLVVADLNIQGGDLPTVVVYTDAGTVLVHVTVYQADGAANSCNYAGLARLRLVVDDTTAVVSDDCARLIVDAVNSGYLMVGTHSVRVEGLDLAGNVVATSETINVSVVAGTNVEATLELHLPMP